jgi:hypothetical protein
VNDRRRHASSIGQKGTEPLRLRGRTGAVPIGRAPIRLCP